MAHRLIGGAAALRMANMNTKAAVFFLDKPMAPTTVATMEPSTKIEMLPAPVSAPGISMNTAIKASKIHLLWKRPTRFLVTVVIAPVAEYKLTNMDAATKSSAISRLTNRPSTSTRGNELVHPKPTPNNSPTTAVMAREISGDFKKIALSTKAATMATRTIDVLAYMDMNVALLTFAV